MSGERQPADDIERRLDKLVDEITDKIYEIIDLSKTYAALDRAYSGCRELDQAALKEIIDEAAEALNEIAKDLAEGRLCEGEIEYAMWLLAKLVINYHLACPKP